MFQKAKRMLVKVASSKGLKRGEMFLGYEQVVDKDEAR